MKAAQLRDSDDSETSVDSSDFAASLEARTRDVGGYQQLGQPERRSLSFFEGKARWRFVLHRKREAELRPAKIAEATIAGRLVPKCGFDFQKCYGELGIGYAQVHHKIPLNKAPPEGRKIALKDLAVVCANCHVMIHRYGRCRDLEGLIA